MKLQTPVADEKCKVGISYKDKITMLGSCFSDNIGRQLYDFGFDVCINPFGTLYNPASILNSIDRLISGTEFTDEDCVQIGAGDERFCSFSHHTSFARKDRADFIANANAALRDAAGDFARSTKVIITLGTSWCYLHNESGTVVSNCLKRPASEYTRTRLSPEDTAGYLRSIIDKCRMAESDTFLHKEFIFTVSPIRHFKDGAHGNQISKAGLLLGVEDALQTEGTDYFPAYEIMMDQLRDYRFYAEDMCHPSSQAVDYIRERFLDWALPSQEHDLLAENIRLFKRCSHISR